MPERYQDMVILSFDVRVVCYGADIGILSRGLVIIENKPNITHTSFQTFDLDHWEFSPFSALQCTKDLRKAYKPEK